jgi:hypothetical protein
MFFYELDVSHGELEASGAEEHTDNTVYIGKGHTFFGPNSNYPSSIT